MFHFFNRIPLEEDGWVMEKGFSLSPSQHIIMRHEETHTECTQYETKKGETKTLYVRLPESNGSHVTTERKKKEEEEDCTQLPTTTNVPIHAVRNAFDPPRCPI